ncbi:hypothetical protein E3T26_00665 [Cryobacterium sp. TMT1-21]|uniref:Pilus assembly protein n=1 Tax=Cryobacterium shii TaxID=1259235 RepID=A0AAQ2HH15_9MICO|nr:MULTISPECIES: hypothetical protein [Cryobacterium]TFC53236.1 hypothetical protein E3O49_00200 [Cryobacterium shii]TFC83198.1 hypothetical protein E3T24_12385 [Cryobacterium sp. TmT2-59]TFD17953.1 hypothetical protein E3T42_06590 [Cryobacterium sp. TMT4-10]TFD18160.1 hypothetical protein E3T26_00665 [Cryobacterium sp. TMT1-21]TFD24972.1 hypothetical protein E3T32_04140 [Cryobacterium sp. TMT2-23]
MLPSRTCASPAESERGSASLEFITAGLILLVPLVYLVLAMAALQGGALAVEGAARQAARVYVQAPDEATATARAERAVQFGLADYGIDAADAEMSVDCRADTDGCLTRRGTVTVTVRIRVPLPLVPDVLSLRNGSSVPLEASATQTVSRFWRSG